MLQYRWEFFLDAFLSTFWTVTAILPLYLVFKDRPMIAGWQYGEALCVVGFFTILQAILEGAVNPSLVTVIDHIRQGTLDFVLIKPADAQFLVSTAKFQLWRVIQAFAGVFIFVWAFIIMGRVPTLVDVASGTLMLILAVVLLYSMWILIVCVAFYAVRIDNLRYLFSSIFDAARWPVYVFKGSMRFVFLFVIPLGLMTTYPAEALLGKIELEQWGISLLMCLLFVVVSRRVWLRSLKAYRSASS